MATNDPQVPPGGQVPPEPSQPKAAQEEQHGHPLLTQHNYHGIIDQRITQAISDGLFNNLPGTGQPLRLDDDSLVPEEDRAGHRLLKGSGFAPPWVEARRDIEEERAKLHAWLTEANARWPHADKTARERLRADYRSKLEDLQRSILTFNLTAPPGVAHERGLVIATELRKLGA